MNVSLSDNQSIVRRVTDPTYIPGGSRVYVADINGLPGFENNLVAAFQKKRVNLIVVADRAQADFEINGYAESQKAGWAKIIFKRGLPESEAPKVEMRVQLVVAIKRSIEKQGLTQAQAAVKAGVGRTVITAIVNGNLARISTDRLIDVAQNLGLRVQLKVA